MYTLLRPHHSIYIGDNETHYRKFLEFTNSHNYISRILNESSFDLLLQWRIAFNCWVFLRTPEKYTIIDDWRKMIFPSMHHILITYESHIKVMSFKRKYITNERILYIAAILFANECMKWFEETFNDIEKKFDHILPLMKTDFYLLFEQEDPPAELVLFLTYMYKEVREKTYLDNQFVSYYISKSIDETEKMFLFIEQEGVD